MRIVSFSDARNNLKSIIDQVSARPMLPPPGLELKAMRPTRRGARMGFPVRQWRGRLQQLLRQGRSVVLVVESGESLQRLRERVPVARWAIHTA